MTLLLIGMMGSGKSTVGEILAAQLGIPFIDLDSIIEKMTGKSVYTLFDQFGESHFRKLESEILKENINKNAVISCGGGIILGKENRVLLKSGTVIYLDASISELKKRLKNANERPLLKNGTLEESLRQILIKREKLYTKCANIIINVNGEIPDDISHKIISLLN
ncbi:MAG: shikimate kinase [Candidatus Marinimicrobia bacterium]|nr:shikimate kinase [Candidatus Neomarinimicrobiota bacterium]